MLISVALPSIIQTSLSMTIAQERLKDISRNGLPKLAAAELAAVNLVRKQGPLSRTDLAELLDVSRASVTSLAGNLVELNVLEEVGHGKSEGGRRPRLLDINAELGFIAGVDVGATSIDLALANFRGDILEKRSEPADVRKAPEQVLNRVIQLIVELLEKQGVE